MPSIDPFSLPIPRLQARYVQRSPQTIKEYLSPFFPLQDKRSAVEPSPTKGMNMAVLKNRLANRKQPNKPRYLHSSQRPKKIVLKGSKALRRLLLGRIAQTVGKPAIAFLDVNNFSALLKTRIDQPADKPSVIPAFNVNNFSISTNNVLCYLGYPLLPLSRKATNPIPANPNGYRKLFAERVVKEIGKSFKLKQVFSQLSQNNLHLDYLTRLLLKGASPNAVQKLPDSYFKEAQKMFFTGIPVQHWVEMLEWEQKNISFFLRKSLNEPDPVKAGR